MKSIVSYRELKVWQKSMEACKLVYRFTGSFPIEEKFGLVSQMRRAAVSIPSNISEGHSRNTTGEFKQALGIANGSLSELETLTILSQELSYMSESNAKILLDETLQIGKMLTGLKKAL